MATALPLPRSESGQIRSLDKQEMVLVVVCEAGGQENQCKAIRGEWWSF